MYAIHQHHICKHSTQQFKYMQGTFRYTPVVFYGNTFIIYKYNPACQVYDNQVNENNRFDCHITSFLFPALAFYSPVNSFQLLLLFCLISVPVVYGHLLQFYPLFLPLFCFLEILVCQYLWQFLW